MRSRKVIPKEKSITNEGLEGASGEQKVSGSMPDPESDDNVLDAANAAGLYLDAKEGKPKRIGLGEQINSAEKLRRGGR